MALELAGTGIPIANGVAMGLSGAVVLYAVIWALTFYCLLPLGIRSQSETRRIVPGTPPSAPSDTGLRWKVLRATVIGTMIWVLVAGSIELDVVPLSALESALTALRE